MSTPVVLDCGSRKSKVGFAGDDDPVSIFDTVVGRPRSNTHKVNKAKEKTCSTEIYGTFNI